MPLLGKYGSAIQVHRPQYVTFGTKEARGKRRAQNPATHNTDGDCRRSFGTEACSKKSSETYTNGKWYSGRGGEGIDIWISEYARELLRSCRAVRSSGRCIQS